MGLAVSVGYLADLMANDPDSMEWVKEDLAAVNEVLVENGHPAHKEPMRLPEFQSRADVDGFPYSFLHHLRRIYAYVVNYPDVKPTPVKKGEATDDPILALEMEKNESHLITHSDAEGLYVPIHFEKVLADDRLPGGFLGSTQQLMAELLQIAPAMGVRLDGQDLPDREADRINDLIDDETGLWKELCVWICLFEAARLSIEHSTVISFS